jgi:hypothetical protein
MKNQTHTEFAEYTKLIIMNKLLCNHHLKEDLENPIIQESAFMFLSSQVPPPPEQNHCNSTSGCYFCLF